MRGGEAVFFLSVPSLTPAPEIPGFGQCFDYVAEIESTNADWLIGARFTYASEQYVVRSYERRGTGSNPHHLYKGDSVRLFVRTWSAAFHT